MTLKTRLGRLEQPAVKRWREVWQAYADHLFSYLDPVLDSLKVTATETEAQKIFKDGATLDAECDSFCQRIGVPSPFVLSNWEAKSDLPDPDVDPDLNFWPKDLIEPPPEPSGVWEKLEPYRNSPDVHERLPALLYLFWLSHARARREYISGADNNH